jgi:hypothetical protein
MSGDAISDVLEQHGLLRFNENSGMEPCEVHDVGMFAEFHVTLYVPGLIGSSRSRATSLPSRS